MNVILTKNCLVLRFESIEGSNIHQQLLAAQEAVFEAELFEQVCFVLFLAFISCWHLSLNG